MIGWSSLSFFFASSLSTETILETAGEVEEPLELDELAGVDPDAGFPGGFVPLELLELLDELDISVSSRTGDEETSLFGFGPATPPGFKGGGRVRDASRYVVAFWG